MPHAPAGHGHQVTHAVAAPVSAAAAFPNFSYHGGPVVGCPLVYASYWGSAWSTDADHVKRSQRLNQYLTDLVASKYMNVLSQYGAGAGAGTGLFVQSSVLVSPPAEDLTDSQIQKTIQACIDAGVLPEPGTPTLPVLIIYLAEGISVQSPADDIHMCEPKGDTAFGYHSFFTTTAGHSFYYAVIPALNDACLKQTCRSDTSCSLHLSETQEQRQTQVTSHEFAEMITDPELNAWFDPQASENGDICNGAAATITVGSDTWTVQRTYSKSDDIATNGTSICLAEADAPIPQLSPGPSGLAAATLRTLRPGTFDRLLPLPAIHFDLSTKTVTRDNNALLDYVAQAFAPLPHDRVAPGLGTLLRQIADTIEK